MYLAEIRGKLSKKNENREDILTSNVFSFFKYASREIFLYSFIRSLGIEITRRDALQAEFHFWPRFDDHTEPDLVIIVGDYYLLIEAKYLSGFGQETDRLEPQLVREIKGGENEAERLGKKFRLIAVTADYSRTEKCDCIPEETQPAFRWINWQRIAVIIYGILEGDFTLAPETRVFAEDLYRLLQRKNLRSYAGISVLGQATKLADHPDHVFFEAHTARYRGSFIGFLRSLDFEMQMAPPPRSVFFDQSNSFFEKVSTATGSMKRYDGPIFY